jgi:excisionase family DNA binding protein
MTTINPGVTGKGLDVEPLVVRPNKAMQLLDCSRVYLYQLINAGELESYRDGAARKITVRSIRDRIERKVRETQQQTA